MKTYIYNDWLIPGLMLWWSGCGWTRSLRAAQVYRTEAEAEEPLRRMLAVGEHAKPLTR
jgi:hypothetical protein